MVSLRSIYIRAASSVGAMACAGAQAILAVKSGDHKDIALAGVYGALGLLVSGTTAYDALNYRRERNAPEPQQV